MSELVLMVRGSRKTIFNESDGLWYDTWIQPDGSLGSQVASAYKWNDDDFYSVRVWDEEADTVWYAPVAVPEPEAPEPETPSLGLADMTVSRAMNISFNEVKAVLTPQAIKKGLFYREPDHGHWYDSLWFWFCVGLTVLIAVLWWANLTPQIHDDQSSLGAFVAYWGWLGIGWIPLGAGLTGAIRCAGYRRLAAAWALAMTVLVSMFWNSQMKDSGNNR